MSDSGEENSVPAPEGGHSWQPHTVEDIQLNYAKVAQEKEGQQVDEGGANDDEKGDVIHTGYLVKLGARVKNWKKRFFILTKTYLLYYTDPSKATPKGKIQVKDITEVKPATFMGKKGEVNGLVIFTPLRTYQLYSDEGEDLEVWSDHFNTAMSANVAAELKK